MSRIKKEGTFVSLKMETEAAELLEKLSKDSGIPKTKIIEKSVKMFAEDYYRKLELLEQMRK